MDASSIHFPQTYNNYTFPPEFFADVSSEETSPENMLFNNYNHMAPLMSSSVPDCMALSTEPEPEMGLRDLAGFSYKNQIFEPGDQEISSGLMATNNYYPAYHDQVANDQHWGLQGKQEAATVEEAEVKIGRYSVEERKGRILRYLKKRNQRNFNKTIKYACRKTLADKRVRVRGRFAKNNERSEEENVSSTSDHSFGQNVNSFYDEMIYDDDDWLQAAMAGLVYLPYQAG